MAGQVILGIVLSTAPSITKTISSTASSMFSFSSLSVIGYVLAFIFGFFFAAMIGIRAWRNTNPWVTNKGLVAIILRPDGTFNWATLSTEIAPNMYKAILHGRDVTVVVNPQHVIPNENAPALRIVPTMLVYSTGVPGIELEEAISVDPKLFAPFYYANEMLKIEGSNPSLSLSELARRGLIKGVVVDPTHQYQFTMSIDTRKLAIYLSHEILEGVGNTITAMFTRVQMTNGLAKIFETLYKSSVFQSNKWIRMMLIIAMIIIVIMIIISALMHSGMVP
jgi:hypothetical protein